MPNWCNNTLTFMSNGTPEGDIALQDFHNKIIQTKGYINPFKFGGYDSEYTWECDVEDISFDQSNGLFEFCDKIDFPKRGYITFISDINYGVFHVVTQDAWSPNVIFWYYLLKRMYGDLITFNYIAYEPNMGIYCTNDPGVLPRRNLIVHAHGNELINIPTAWDLDNSIGPFMHLNTNNPNIYEFLNYPTSGFEFDLEVDGDDDEIIACCEDNIFGHSLPNVNDVYDLQKELSKIGLTTNINIFMNDYVYSSVEEDIEWEHKLNQFIKGENNGNTENK